MNRIKKMFYADRWTIAYRESTSSVFENKDGKFHYLTFPKGYWGADPFLWECNNIIYVFCEFTNEKKSKAFIAFKKLYPIEEKNWTTCFEFLGHTSYPCIFSYENEIYMVPETTFDNSIKILKYDKKKNKWNVYSTLIHNINAPDSTFVLYNNKPCLFVYEIIEQNKRLLHFCELSVDLKSITTNTVVKEYHCPDGRPGGNCIISGDKYFRVVQPGIHFYGEKIVKYEFTFTSKEYIEKKIDEVLPSQLTIDKKDMVLGLHTYNRLGRIEVIDVFIRGKFDFFRPAKILFKKFGLFGYGQYDTKHKFVNQDFTNNR